MHPILSVAAALALAARPSPAAPPVAASGPTKVSAPAPTPAAAPAAATPAAATPAAAAPAAEVKAQAPVGLAVVPLDAPAELALVGRSLAEAIAQEAVKMPGFRVLAPSAVLEKLGADGAALATQCGESASCYGATASRLGVERVVGGRLDRVGTNYRFGLVFVDAGAGAAIARVTREVPIASRRLRADVVAAAGPLLRGEAAGTGVLAVVTEVPGAEVRVDDRPAGRTPLEARLPAGKHKVEVVQRGKVRVEPFWVDVPANGRAEQRVRLFDIPVAERRPGEIETTVEKVPVKGRSR